MEIRRLRGASGSETAVMRAWSADVAVGDIRFGPAEDPASVNFFGRCRKGRHVASGRRLGVARQIRTSPRDAGAMKAAF